MTKYTQDNRRDGSLFYKAQPVEYRLLWEGNYSYNMAGVLGERILFIGGLPISPHSLTTEEASARRRPRPH